MSRIIQPIGDRIIIPKRKIRKPSYKMWMGLEDRFPPRALNPKLSMRSILTSGSVGGPSASPSGGTEDPGDYLICQNFEGAGYDNSEVWTETIGGGAGAKVDENDTTAPVLRGSQQLRINGGAGTTSDALSPIFADSDTVYVHFRFRIDVVGSSGYYIFFTYDHGLNNAGYAQINNDGTLTVSHGTKTVTTVGALSADTIYHVWFRYTKSTGIDGIYSIGFSTTTTEPTSGNNYASGTNGDSTYHINYLKLFTGYAKNVDYDQVLVKTTSIGNVFE